MNTLNTTKEEVSAEAILKKKPSINGPGNDVYYEYTDVIEALEEYANTVISSQKGEEAIAFLNWYTENDHNTNASELYQLYKQQNNL
jgi:hypothetical protein